MSLLNNEEIFYEKNYSFIVLLFTLCTSLVFAYSFGMSNEDILDLFDAISFDYTQLTNIDTNQAKKNLEIILENNGAFSNIFIP